MRQRISLFFIVLLGLIIGCTEPPDYPNEPQLRYIGLNKNTIVQGRTAAQTDTLIIMFSFTDGNGDLGDETVTNLFIRDSRDNSLNPVVIKPIPEQGSGNGISGEITVRLINNNDASKMCCIFPDRRVCFTDPRYPIDTFSYSIQMKDRAGNLSNVIRTERITLLCQ